MTNHPPKWLLRFFRWYCHPDYAEDIEGDLAERFSDNLEKTNFKKAKKQFLIDVLLLFRPGIIRPFHEQHLPINYAMFKHNLLISYRGFLRNKSAFLINLTGLSTGLACVLMIYLWVNDELSVDKFHENDSQLYQVMQNFELPNGIQTWDYGPGPLAEEIVEDMPEVEAATKSNNMYFYPKGLLSDGDNHIGVSGLFADEHYFELFSYNLIEGVASQVLADKGQIVISEDMALRLFQSTENVIGKTIRWKNRFVDTTFQVSGIFENVPANSTKQFEAVIHYDWLVFADRWAADWNGGYAETYLLLKEGTDIALFNQKIAKYFSTKAPGWEQSTQFVRSYSSRYLHAAYEEGTQIGGRIEYVRLFSFIGLFILLIACINFMNLATAQATKKMKEIGVKRAIGASRKTLISQFLMESMLIVTFALVSAMGFVVLLLPQFSRITGKILELDISMNLLLSIVSIGLITGLISGSYPAFYLSGFKPLNVLKGRLATSIGELWVRKGLVISQFSLSVIFIVGVLVVNQQMKYIQTKNLGYNRDNVISFDRPEFTRNTQAFLTELQNIPGVKMASNMFLSILNGTDSQSGYSWSGQEGEKEYLFQAPMVGYDALETLDMELVAGRTFSREYNDDESKIILNESAVRMMGLENPVGYVIDKGASGTREVIGVVKDFHYGSIHKKVAPLIFRFRNFGRHIMVKVKAGTEQTTLAQIKEVYKQFHTNYPFEYTFLDEDYAALYEAEQRVASLSKYFSALAIIISCLGLFGLAAFTAERRVKEIGIRKVLGASVWGIVKMLSTDFSKMVITAIVIAMPISYLAVKNWLEDFAYRIDLQWWFFGVAAILTLLIAWCTIGVQTFKAARVNPVKCLRDE